MSEKKSFLKSAGTVSGLILLSRILGVLRDSFIASRLGASVYNDIFNIAIGIPNMLRRVLGEGSLSAIIVPTFSQHLYKDGKKEAFKFASNVFNVISLFTFSVMVIGMTFAKYIFLIWGASYYKKGQFEYIVLGTDLVRIMFPIVMLLSMFAIAMGILHSFKHFVAPSLGSICMNLAIIIASILFTNRTKVQYAYIFSWTVLAASFLQIAIMIPPLIKRGLEYTFVFNLKDKKVSELLRLLLPAFYGLSISQINIIINMILATWISVGVVTFLTYSNRLIQFPLALIANSLGVAILPQITKHYLENNKEELHNLMTFALRILIILFIPATVGFIALGQPVIEILLQHGKWTAADSAGTYTTLVFYSLGLLPFASLKILIPMFYAKKDMTTPVKAATVSIITNVILNIAFILFTPLKAGGLALATSLATLANASFLFSRLRAQTGPIIDKKMIETFIKTVIVSVIMGIISKLAYDILSGYAGKAAKLIITAFPTHPEITVIINFIITLSCVGFGVLIFILGAKLINIPDLKDAENILMKRFRK